ncbi:hypothetical protein [Microvirga sp. KLBC 81]|nr:hypothetical protein [Microvirga sp. KLBC 81]
MRAITPLDVITGLVPVIPMLGFGAPLKRDGRDKPGHDEELKMTKS